MACRCGNKNRGARPAITQGLRSVSRKPTLPTNRQTIARGTLKSLPSKRIATKSPSGMTKERRIIERKRREAALKRQK